MTAWKSRFSAWPSASPAAAARQLEAAMTQSVRVRFDPDQRPPSQAQLLSELHAYEAAEKAISPLHDDASLLAGRLDEILTGANRASSRLKMFFSGRRRRDEARQALGALDALMNSPEAVQREVQAYHRSPLRLG
jgi:hypothetical protein